LDYIFRPQLWRRPGQSEEEFVNEEASPSLLAWQGGGEREEGEEEGASQSCRGRGMGQQLL
jgi:hypothetical protein